MSYRKAIRAQNFDAEVIRPALVEGRLMTDKHIRDTVYVVTLTEELRDIEAKRFRLEQELHLASTATPCECRPASSDRPDAQWIRAKSCELENRLRQVQLSTTTDDITVQ